MQLVSFGTFCAVMTGFYLALLMPPLPPWPFAWVIGGGVLLGAWVGALCLLRAVVSRSWQGLLRLGLSGYRVGQPSSQSGIHSVRHSDAHPSADPDARISPHLGTHSDAHPYAPPSTHSTNHLDAYLDPYLDVRTNTHSDDNPSTHPSTHAQDNPSTHPGDNPSAYSGTHAGDNPRAYRSTSEPPVNADPHSAARTLVLFGLVIVAAWILGTIQISRQLSKDLPAACERRAVDAVVTVTSFPQTTQTADFHQVRFRGDIAIADPLCARVRTVDVTWYDPTEHIELGDVLQVTAVLLPLRSQHSPGVAPDLLQRRVQAEHARVRLKSVFKQQSAARFSVARLRLGIAAQIREAVADPFAQRVLIALTVGDQGALSEDDWRLFRHLGLSHVMVISGLHIGLVAWCAYALVGLPRRCYRLPGDRGSIRKAVVAALVVATLYALLAGLSLPVLRALAMLYALLVTKLLGWQTNPLWTLGLVAVVLAALQPFVLVSGSFYFSFGAVALLLWSRAVVGTWRPWQAAVFVQVLMTLASLPLSLFWFGEGSLLAIPVNLLVTPILSLVVVPAAVCLALVGVLWSGLSVPWHWLGDGLALLLQVLVSGSQWVGTWGVITIDLYLPALLAFAALIVGLVCLKGTLRRLALALAGVALMAEALRPPSQPLLAVLDVGQGTAVVLRTPTHTLLYDTGGGNPGVYTQAEKVVLPFLQWARLPWARRGTLTQFIVSHGDQDHSAGLAVVREHMAPGDHWGFGGKACRPGQVLWSDETLFLQVLGGTGHDKDARNADSCVLRMEFGGMTVLLAGDVPVKTELAMVRYWREALAADILVVGHHGSATSTSEAWLRWVAPQRAALSYARANPFGHPAEDVVGRLQRRGIAIDSTAHRGTLLYRGAGHGVIDVRSSRSPWTPRWLYLPQDK